MVRSYNISKGLVLFVAAAGMPVMAGWVFDIDILKSILPGWGIMKAATAISFILSGITLYFIAESQQKNSSAALIILPITAMALLLLMITNLSANFLGLRMGVEELFVKEVNAAIMSTTPARPSIPTMVGFILIAIAAILTMLNPANLKIWLVFLGGVVIFIGAMAAIGYIFNVPVLYYHIEKVSAAMSFHSSVLFILTGLSLIFAGNKERLKEHR